MTVAVTAQQQTETLLLSILIQLIVMIGAARLMNLLFRRCGQPGVIESRFVCHGVSFAASAARR